MNSIFNQYSYLFISVGALLAMFIILRVLKIQWRLTLASLITIAGILIIGWFILRPAKGDVDSVKSAEAVLTNGKPTFVEFFSQYCLGCLAARPAVDSLISNIQDRFNILRVDIHTDYGRDLRERYHFSYSPEFVLLDQNGEEVWRAHVPPSLQELQLLFNPILMPGNS
jgi:thiol-disulfide isomerase/thioredoxin